MKISTKKLLLLAAVGSVVMLSAFKINQKVKQVSEIRNEILDNLLVQRQYSSEDYNAETYPDTTITFNAKEGAEFKAVLTKGNFYSIPYIYPIAKTIDAENSFGTKEYNETFKATFGANILGKNVKMAAFYVNDETKKKVYDEFTFYAKDGIQKAFDKLYVKPTADFEGYSMKKLYDLAAKDYVRDFSKLLVYLMVTKKAAFEQAGKTYLLKATTDKNFYHRDVCVAASKKLFPTEDSKKQFKAFQDEIYEGTIGSLLRRQCDGTLPTLVNCIKTVLKDYDPEGLKIFSGKL
jgi:hypothetical protein